MQHFNILTSLCSWAGWFEQYQVGNLEDRISRVAAHLERRCGDCIWLFQILTSSWYFFCNMSNFRSALILQSYSPATEIRSALRGEFFNISGQCERFWYIVPSTLMLSRDLNFGPVLIYIKRSECLGKPASWAFAARRCDKTLTKLNSKLFVRKLDINQFKHVFWMLERGVSFWRFIWVPTHNICLGREIRK